MVGLSFIIVKCSLTLNVTDGNFTLERRWRLKISSESYYAKLIKPNGRKKAYMEVFGEIADEPKKDEPAAESADAGEVEVPDWMITPDNWFDMTAAQQKKHIFIETRKRTLAEKIARSIEKENKIMDFLQKKSKKEYKALYQLYQVNAWKAELECMIREEESKENNDEIAALQDNLKKINFYCREKGEEELHARSVLKKREELANLREKELAEASAWVDVCMKRSRQRDKLKRKVTEECKWVDSDSITGFYQRFRTELLRERLYYMYFRQLLGSIINKSETIATERKLMKIQEKLSSNRANLLDRTINLKK